MLLSARLVSASDRARLFGLGNRLGDELRIATEQLGLLDKLAALDLEHLNPPPPFLGPPGHLEWRNQSSQTEIVDLFEALLHVLARRLLAAVGVQRVADRLDMDGGP